MSTRLRLEAAQVLRAHSPHVGQKKRDALARAREHPVQGGATAEGSGQRQRRTMWLYDNGNAYVFFFGLKPR